MDSTLGNLVLEQWFSRNKNKYCKQCTLFFTYSQVKACSEAPAIEWAKSEDSKIHITPSR